MSRKILQTSQDPNDSEAYCWTNKNLNNVESLLEIGTMGAGHATTALSEIVHEQIEVEVPRLHTAPPHLVPKIYGRHERPTTVIYMQLKGDLDGDIMLAFDADEAKQIAAMMTMTPNQDEVDPALEKSAMEELGSIMICSFVSAIADFAEIQLIPTPPQLVTDTFDAIIDGFLAKQALVCDIALMFDATFRRTHSKAGGTIILFPSLELQETLLKKARKLVS
jgi:chemotaxis protein CheC